MDNDPTPAADVVNQEPQQRPSRENAMIVRNAQPIATLPTITTNYHMEIVRPGDVSIVKIVGQVMYAMVIDNKCMYLTGTGLLYTIAREYLYHTAYMDDINRLNYSELLGTKRSLKKISDYVQESYMPVLIR